MSKIAEALAKAKERTGTSTAPFIAGHPPSVPGGGPSDPATARILKKARDRQRVWIALLTVAVALTAFVLWDQLRGVRDLLAKDEAQPELPVDANPYSTDPFASPVDAADAPASPPANLAAPRPELYDTVNLLVITAVLPGERPRLMYEGRIIAVGDTVSGELTFAGIHEGRVIFRDQRGALYARRY